jgi:hypothetical protein
LYGLCSISVREEDAVALVESLSGRKPHWMPDPALLLDDYAAVTCEPEDKDYVFSYCLRGNEHIPNVHNCVAKSLRLRVVSPYNSQQFWGSEGLVVHLGPSEWAGRMKCARAVVTNTFHGTVFSILFQRPFIAVPLAGRKEDLNGRLVSLLTRLGLVDRLLFDIHNTTIERVLNTQIDWEDVHARLELWRSEAREYFTVALG